MIESEQRAVLTYGPDPSKAFGGLTPQQYRYCQLRSKGAAKLHAYRQAFDNQTTSDDTVQNSIYRMEADARIGETINRMVLAGQPETSLVPQVDKTFVLTGITNIATKETAKDNVRLRAYELLGKAVGLFKDEAPAVAKPRTIEDIDRELRERLQSMRTIEGAVTRVEPDTLEPAHEPSPTNDRRRKPRT